MEDSKLRLIKSDSNKTKKVANNFWSCCPIANKALPASPCPHGKPNLKAKKTEFEPTCSWWINSEKYQYCFWRFIHENSAADGSMKELQLAEIARLFGWSSTKAHFQMKEALDELTIVFKRKGVDLSLLDFENHSNINHQGDYTSVDPE